jgi:hypothetical protein
MFIHPGAFILTILGRFDPTSGYIHGRPELLLQMEFDWNSDWRQTPPARHTDLSPQLPGYQDATVGAQKPDLASQWPGNVQVLINAGQILVQFVFLAGTGFRL